MVDPTQSVGDSEFGQIFGDAGDSPQSTSASSPGANSLAASLSNESNPMSGIGGTGAFNSSTPFGSFTATTAAGSSTSATAGGFTTVDLVIGAVILIGGYLIWRK